MCAAPISAADGWTGADADWERLQVEAALAQAAGDLTAAASSFAAALRTARGFDPDDPRLATSLANYACVLRQKRQAVPVRLWEEALEIWDEASAWLARQRLAPRALSSTFHLRLEAKHPGAYQENLRRRAEPLFAEGRMLTEALAASVPAEVAGPVAWQAARPAGFDALRKVLAAVRLLSHSAAAPPP